MELDYYHILYDQGVFAMEKEAFLQIVTILRQDEGCRLKPYRDTRGILTIGYGRNLEHVGISEGEAGILLENDIKRAEQVARYAASAHDVRWEQLPEDMQTALVLMAFQLGYGLVKFRRMWRAVRAQDRAEMVKEMWDSAWAVQTPARVKRCQEILGVRSG